MSIVKCFQTIRKGCKVPFSSVLEAFFGLRLALRELQRALSKLLLEYLLVLKLITVAATDESELMEAIHREGLVLDDSKRSLTT